MVTKIRRTLLASSAVVVAVAVSVQGASAATTVAKQYNESEAATAAGHNDAASSAQRLYGFGTAGWQNSDAVVHGTLSPSPVAISANSEDDGAIPLAVATGIGTDGRSAITTTGVLGDGPHGTAGGDGTNDFDFYALNGTAGHTLTVTTDGSAASTDTVAGVYDANGQLLASDNDSGVGLQSRLTFQLPATGTYYVIVAGNSGAGSFPADPNNSGSGLRGGDEGGYTVLIAAAPLDKDFYRVELKKGDVLGGSLATSSPKRLTVFKPNGTQAVSSSSALTSVFPASSPLPVGGSAVFGYVAEQSGWYAVSVTDGFGAYDLNLAARRPGTATDNAAQTIFLDFNGGEIDTAPLGGPGVRQLSGLSTFLGNWGLSAADESAVISKAVAVVTENVKTDLVAKGLNPDVAVKIRNSRDDADTFGSANVSRVVVGGRVSESGIGTASVAESIDPGNFAHEETALIQLDRLSAASGSSTINRFLTPSSDRVAFVGQVLGNLASRQIGHLVGNFTTDQTNTVANLMDADGNFAQLYGAGADGVGGTADDADVDFGKDSYAPATGLTGTQDTLNVAAWGLSKPCN